MDDGRTTAVGAWASLTLDLLLEVFRRLESTAVIRCSGVCKPWRRAIIGNASFLRPRLDRFVPNLLLGVFHDYGDDNHQHVYLRRTPARPFQSALLPSTGGAAGSESRIQSLIPATGGFDREMYTDLLSSRDGFILLRGRRWWSGVCLLCNPVTGDCKILPDATIIRSCVYILLTGNAGQDLQAVRILAVAVAGRDTNTMCTKENRITYQVFSFTSGGHGAAGAWGSVNRCSIELKQDIQVPDIWVPMDNPCTVVCGDAVYWLAGPKVYHAWWSSGNPIIMTVALDVHTGRAWTTVLPEETMFSYYGGGCTTHTLLGTSGNGRLSLIHSITTAQQIQVWVLMDDDQWSLQKTIDVQVQKPLQPNYLYEYDYDFKYRGVPLDVFCPRSGCVIGRFAGQEIRIDLEGSSHPCVAEWIGNKGFYYCNNTYEMDWSTYVSKMKQF